MSVGGVKDNQQANMLTQLGATDGKAQAAKKKAAKLAKAKAKAKAKAVDVALSGKSQGAETQQRAGASAGLRPSYGDPSGKKLGNKAAAGQELSVQEKLANFYARKQAAAAQQPQAPLS